MVHFSVGPVGCFAYIWVLRGRNTKGGLVGLVSTIFMSIYHRWFLNNWREHITRPVIICFLQLTIATRLPGSSTEMWRQTHDYNAEARRTMAEMSHHHGETSRRSTRGLFDSSRTVHSVCPGLLDTGRYVRHSSTGMEA